MFGSKKRKEQAQRLFIESSKMITAIMNNTELQPLEPGVGAPVYAGCIFIVTSFLRKEKVALEMVPVYGASLLSSYDITKEQHDYYLNRLNFCYQEIRSTMIEAQDEVGNNLEVLFFAMCDKICDLAHIKNKLKATDILLGYFSTFIDRAKLILY